MTTEMGSILAETRALVNSFMTDTCTNSRTGLMVPCRLSLQTRTERLGSLPHYLRLPTYEIVTPNGTDLRMNDALTVKDPANVSRGVFTVLEVKDPSTLSVSTTASAMLARHPDGTVGLLFNTTATFRQKYTRTGQSKPDEIGPVSVMVDYIDPEAMLRGTGFTYQMAVTWDSGLVFPDTQTPKEGDFLLWSGVSGGKTALRYPRPVVLLPAFTAYIEGSPA